MSKCYDTTFLSSSASSHNGSVMFNKTKKFEGPVIWYDWMGPLQICSKTGIPIYDAAVIWPFECETLGRGAYGKVRALHKQFSGFCFKKNHANAEREIEILLRLQHLAVPQIIGITPDRTGFIMSRHQYTLNDWVSRMSPTKEQMLAVFIELAWILQDFHAEGYIHNDIKTDNVMVDLSPENEVLKVTVVDLGLTRKIGINPFPRSQLPWDLPSTGSFTRLCEWFAPAIYKGEGGTPNTDAFSLAYAIESLIITSTNSVSSPFAELLRKFSHYYGDESACCIENLLKALHMEMDGSYSLMGRWVADLPGKTRQGNSTSYGEREKKGDTETETPKSTHLRRKIQALQEIILNQKKDLSAMNKQIVKIKSELRREKIIKHHIWAVRGEKLREYAFFKERHKFCPIPFERNVMLRKRPGNFFEGYDELATLRYQVIHEQRKNDELWSKMHWEKLYLERKFQETNDALKSEEARGKKREEELERLQKEIERERRINDCLGELNEFRRNEKARRLGQTWSDPRRMMEESESKLEADYGLEKLVEEWQEDRALQEDSELVSSRLERRVHKNVLKKWEQLKSRMNKDGRKLDHIDVEKKTPEGPPGQMQLAFKGGVNSCSQEKTNRPSLNYRLQENENESDQFLNESDQFLNESDQFLNESDQKNWEQMAKDPRSESRTLQEKADYKLIFKLKEEISKLKIDLSDTRQKTSFIEGNIKSEGNGKCDLTRQFENTEKVTDELTNTIEKLRQDLYQKDQKLVSMERKAEQGQSQQNELIKKIHSVQESLERKFQEENKALRLSLESKLCLNMSKSYDTTFLSSSASSHNGSVMFNKTKKFEGPVIWYDWMGPLQICSKTGIPIYDAAVIWPFECETLGRGAYGKVRALHKQFSGFCFKKNHANAEREIEILLRLQHLAVPQIIGITPDRTGFIMSRHQYTLNDWVSRMSPTKEQMLAVFIELAWILQDFHAEGYIHNDIKTDNVMVDLSPENEVLKVTVVDLGLTRKIGINPFPRSQLPWDLPSTGSFTRLCEWFAPAIYKGEGGTPNTDAFSLAYAIESLIITSTNSVSSPFAELLRKFSHYYGDESACCIENLLKALHMEMDGSYSLMGRWVADLPEKTRQGNSTSYGEREKKGDTETETPKSTHLRRKIQALQEIILNQKKDLSAMNKHIVKMKSELENEKMIKHHIWAVHAEKLREYVFFKDRHKFCHIPFERNVMLTKRPGNFLEGYAELAALRYQVIHEQRKNDELRNKMHWEKLYLERKFQETNDALKSEVARGKKREEELERLQKELERKRRINDCLGELNEFRRNEKARRLGQTWSDPRRMMEESESKLEADYGLEKLVEEWQEDRALQEDSELVSSRLERRVHKNVLKKWEQLKSRMNKNGRKLDHIDVEKKTPEGPPGQMQLAFKGGVNSCSQEKTNRPSLNYRLQENENESDQFLNESDQFLNESDQKNWEQMAKDPRSESRTLQEKADYKLIFKHKEEISKLKIDLSDTRQKTSFIEGNIKSEGNGKCDLTRQFENTEKVTDELTNTIEKLRQDLYQKDQKLVSMERKAEQGQSQQNELIKKIHSVQESLERKFQEENKALRLSLESKLNKVLKMVTQQQQLSESGNDDKESSVVEISIPIPDSFRIYWSPSTWDEPVDPAKLRRWISYYNKRGAFTDAMLKNEKRKLKETETIDKKWRKKMKKKLGRILRKGIQRALRGVARENWTLRQRKMKRKFLKDIKVKMRKNKLKTKDIREAEKIELTLRLRTWSFRRIFEMFMHI
ncbi:putative leucine-rich repeat-containing protein DDB_G0290503 [Palaemon carinicauda]|uniref:putative leucine-rich repeat-containing protein DDB_G0290503 n=1 Tax=Palaemon carinicauda TaxID=392227 RepID=UPI0035B5DBC6